MRLSGKVAIITGAGSGFGAGIAERFAREGARVVVNDIDDAGGERTVAAITRATGAEQAFYVRADVSKDGDVEGLVKSTLERFGRVDIIVNNAGCTHANVPMVDVDEATFDRVFAVNVKAIYLAARHVVPVMRRQGTGGAILNVSSTLGIRARPGLVWYGGSKGAVITLSKGMAAELAPHKIRVNALCPTMGDTPLLAQFIGGDTPELRAKAVSMIPLGRLTAPADVANAALYLASDEGAFITGTALEIDGGRCL
jgi:3-oxoacyl-[acyl-carrier protein] reductase